MLNNNEDWYMSKCNYSYKILFEECMKTLNSLDDYFEYSNESHTDKLYVLNELDSLTSRIECIIKSKEVD